MIVLKMHILLYNLYLLIYKIYIPQSRFGALNRQRMVFDTFGDAQWLFCGKVEAHNLQTPVAIMMRVQVLLLLACLLGSTLALRGEKSFKTPGPLRRLGSLEGAEEETEKEVAGTKDAKGEKAKKEKETKSTKSDKKSKKCKKAKGSKSAKSASKSEEATHADTQDEVESAQLDESMPYCLHAALSTEECAAIKEGKVPKDDPNVMGQLEMEFAYDEDKTADEVKRNLEEVLRKETASKFVGCVKRRLRRLAEEGGEEEMMDSEEFLGVTGVDFPKLKLSNKGTP